MPGSGYERARREEEVLAEIEGKHPGWTVLRPVSIWEAVPAGTPVVGASTLADLQAKLDERDGSTLDNQRREGS